MGNCLEGPRSHSNRSSCVNRNPNTPSSEVIRDISQEEFFRQYNASGIREDAQIEIYIDGTASNDHTDVGGVNYHNSSPLRMGVYAKVIRAAVTMLKQDKDARIPMWCFGSQEAWASQDTPGIRCWGEVKFDGNPQPLVDLYHEGISQETLDGPTSFIPIIRQAIVDYQQHKKYQIIFIITDGCVHRRDDHKKALIEASNYPISFVVVGIGPGPFGKMEEFDDMKGRRVDNFQFAAFSDICSEEQLDLVKKRFFYQVFMECPKQFMKFQDVLGYEPSVQQMPVRMSTMNNFQSPPHYQSEAYNPTAPPGGVTTGEP
jgi:hypothetical protein